MADMILALHPVELREDGIERVPHQEDSSLKCSPISFGNPNIVALDDEDWVAIQ